MPGYSCLLLPHFPWSISASPHFFQFFLLVHRIHTLPETIMPVRIQLPALDPAPLPGTTARVVFRAVKGTAHARIPASALVRRGEINGVYVLADGRLSLRQLRLGETLGDEVEVISGLKAGERIVTEGVGKLQAGAKIAAGTAAAAAATTTPTKR